MIKFLKLRKSQSLSYLKRHFGSIFSKQKQIIYRSVEHIFLFRKGLLLALSFTAWRHAGQFENRFTGYTDRCQHFVDGEAHTANVT